MNKISILACLVLLFWAVACNQSTEKEAQNDQQTNELSVDQSLHVSEEVYNSEKRKVKLEEQVAGLTETFYELIKNGNFEQTANLRHQLFIASPTAPEWASSVAQPSEKLGRLVKFTPIELRSKHMTTQYGKGWYFDYIVKTEYEKATIYEMVLYICLDGEDGIGIKGFSAKNKREDLPLSFTLP